MKPTCFRLALCLYVKLEKYFAGLLGSVVVSQNPFKTELATPTPITQFISNYAYYQYFLQALTPTLTFRLKLLVL